ncbi:hypothetical protein BX616_004644 [Lobosporangium transversale]|uniref:Uncharacterized protein n=1 Tax=Lobosporangium transversale TaxID=64571 RepID=A0A1Y2GRA7_9FUNG|nr:hypothetical protein BCR41DRAFT_353281 [Lobosporangium transversale]KAF9897997.1 hypothetical protein BX616_004644 [Lobosporangium transversale]ORZ16846.1 hypothetical protein BCR41DRAFT_353281 [Lobosporangium transversale]|eukprot:XP_021881781.1 hypothetical protein BCR41DRAFT_353281 [Lobosporangium transversale]
METEYLDEVNRELRTIERFFQKYYGPALSSLSSVYTPELLPLLHPESVLAGHQVGSAFTHTTQSTSSPISNDSRLENEILGEERLVENLRARYMQLKAVQDQLHLELTRLRIWSLTKQTSESHQPPFTDTVAATIAAAAPASSPTEVRSKEKKSCTQVYRRVCNLSFLINAILMAYIINQILSNALPLQQSSEGSHRQRYAWPRH